MSRNPNICEQEFPVYSPGTGGPLLGWSRLGALWEIPWRTAWGAQGKGSTPGRGMEPGLGGRDNGKSSGVSPSFLPTWECATQSPSCLCLRWPLSFPGSPQNNQNRVGSMCLCVCAQVVGGRGSTVLEGVSPATSQAEK